MKIYHHSAPRRCQLVNALHFVLLLALFLLLPGISNGQGQLSPPTAVFPYPQERALNPGGHPVPSMKTLMHIDSGEHIPSRDATNTNLDGSLGYYVIDHAGRFYLSENLDKKILITADNVTLDLGGFEIRHVGTGTGPVAIEAQSGIAGTAVRTKVINGRVSGTWQIGVKLNEDSVVSGVDVSDIQSFGITIGNDGLVDQCRVRGPWAPGPESPPPGPFNGIFTGEASVIRACTTTGIAGIGIQGMDNVRVVDCTVNQVAGCGIVTAHDGTVGGCSVRTCGSTGFDLNQGSVLMNSSAVSCGDPGVHVRNGCALHNVTSLNNMDHGFWVENTPPPGAMVLADNATNFVQCVAQGNMGDGFHATSDCSFTHCTADRNGVTSPLASGDGFFFSNQCRLTNCVASGNAVNGYRGNNGNTVDQCSASANGAYGIEVTSDQNVVTRNTLRANVAAPVLPAAGTGQIAPLQSASSATNPFANFGL